MRMKWWVLPFMFLAFASMAQEISFSGAVGMDFLFTPASSFSMQSALTLTMDVGKGGVKSQTILSLTGLEAEHLWLWLNFQGVTLKSGLTFDPCFSRWTLSASGGCCAFFLGGTFLLGNLAHICQTPDYTIGLILEFGVGGEPGFLARSLTGFGVSGLYALIDGDPWTDVTLVPGWFFEEELLHFVWSTQCLRVYTTWMFAYTGLGFGELGVNYRFTQPIVDLGAALRFNSTLSLAWAKLYLGVSVDPVSVYSATAFNFSGLLWEEIGIKIQFSQVLIYSTTRFDLSGLDWIAVGFELKF
ncbi:MAG: hypothetical protein NZ651_02000 [Candidatus Bipolaricaulota bacterium]|nr:hypothetical protein [Candidatus Bipolaricaulota bacterium]MDW8126530.1 hypothetical protein [Candidatus Bipolaricaulota bacterium]